MKPNLQGKKVRCPTCQAISLVPEQLTAQVAEPANALTPTVKPVETPPVLQLVSGDHPPPLRGFWDILLWPFLGTLIGANLLAMFLPVVVQVFLTVELGSDRMRWIMVAGGVVGMLFGILGVSLPRWRGNLLRLLLCGLGLGLPLLLLYPDVLSVKFSQLGEPASFGKLTLLIFEALLLVVTIYAWIRLIILWRRRPLEGEISVFIGSQRLQTWLAGLGAVMVLLVVGVMALGVHEPLREAAQKSAGLLWLHDTLTKIRETKPTDVNLPRSEASEPSGTKPASAKGLAADPPEKTRPSKPAAGKTPPKKKS